MASYKSSVMFACVVIAAAVTVGGGEAQLLGPISGLLSILRIDGTLYCTLNGNIGINGTATPVFSNGAVELQCGSGSGSNNNVVVVATSLTNAVGAFSILVDPLQILLSTLLNSCRLVVTTPLATCNAALPSVGVLTSPLQTLGNALFGILNITRLVPAGFNFIA